MDQITVRQGIYLPWQVTLQDNAGSVVTTYTVDNVPACKVWSGDNTAVSANPTVAWIDPTAGTLLISFKQADTSSLTSGSYVCAVELALTGDLIGETLEVYRANLVVEDSPGTQVTPKTYCSYSDLLDYAPQIAKELADSTQTGFAEQRGKAKDWIDEVILAHAGRWRWRYVKDLLDTDKLIIDSKIKEIAVYRTLSYIFGSSFSASKETTTYLDFAARQKQNANAAIGTLVAWFDTNNDGIGDVHVDCAILSMRTDDCWGWHRYVQG